MGEIKITVLYSSINTEVLFSSHTQGFKSMAFWQLTTCIMYISFDPVSTSLKPNSTSIKELTRKSIIKQLHGFLEWAFSTPANLQVIIYKQGIIITLSL